MTDLKESPPRTVRLLVTLTGDKLVASDAELALRVQRLLSSSELTVSAAVASGPCEVRT